jgi:hypothetical protein
MFAVFTIGQRDFDKGSDATNKRQEVIKNRFLKYLIYCIILSPFLQFFEFLANFFHYFLRQSKI